MRAEVDRRAPIPIDAPWSVCFEWSTQGGPALERGEWGARPGNATHHERYEVSPRTVTPAHCGPPYRAVATVCYRPEGESRALLASAIELGVLSFTQAGA